MVSIEIHRNALSELSGNVACGPPPAAGKKRKGNGPVEEPVNLEDIDCDGLIIDQNCDQVRRRIRSYLDSGKKVGEFCKAISVSNNSLNRFLSQNGPAKGPGSDAYIGAWEFFKKREIAGVKMPIKKQKADAGDANKEPAVRSNIKEAGNSAGVDISGVHLPGELDDCVPVHDTCDEARCKINAHLKLPGVTQAQFCRDMQSMFWSDTSRPNIQSTMLTAFRSKKGPSAGNTSSVYYAAYVFFENVRIQQGKEKSKHRLGMEGVSPREMDRQRSANQG